MDTAAEIFRHCLEAFPAAGRPAKLGHVHVHINLAHTMLAKGEYESAISRYELVLTKYYYNNNSQVRRGAQAVECRSSVCRSLHLLARGLLLSASWL